jgi:hypothetical protein
MTPNQRERWKMFYRKLTCKTDRKRYPYYAEAKDYFYHSYMENDNKCQQVFKELYVTTRQGEDKYFKVQDVMWAYEPCEMTTERKKLINKAVKAIVGKDPNW